MIIPFIVTQFCNKLLIFRELREGLTVVDENNNEYGESVTAAQQGIAAVTFSRIAMACPGMVLTPLLMNALEKRGSLKKMPWANSPIQILFCGLVLTFATPLCCALFSQRAAINVDSLEPELKAKIWKVLPNQQTVYYNKGL